MIPNLDPLAGAISITLRGESLLLLADKAIWWPRTRTLLVTDLHLGKATHFQKNGIYLPQGVQGQDLARLATLLQGTEAVHLLCLGDLFHSVMNEDWQVFQDWRLRQFPTLRFTLVRGNHDILPDSVYAACELDVQPGLWEWEGLAFRHYPFAADETLPDTYVLTGHAHPSVSLSGLGRQRMRVPCFWFGAGQGSLPAFGSFTGMHTLKVQPTDSVFVLSGERVVVMQEGEVVKIPKTV